MLASLPMFSLVALAGILGGLLVIPASPSVGFLMIVGGAASASRAMDEPDDMPRLLGLALMASAAYAAVQVATFIGQLLR